MAAVRSRSLKYVYVFLLEWKQHEITGMFMQTFITRLEGMY